MTTLRKDREASMDELDNLPTDLLGSDAPAPAQIATAFELIGELLATAPTTTRCWERRDHGNGLSYRLWDALPLIHAVAAAHLTDEATSLHAVQAAVRQIKTDEDAIDVLTDQLADLGVGTLKDLLGRTIEVESHGPLSLGAYALGMVDSDAMQEIYARTARTLRERATQTHTVAA